MRTRMWLKLVEEKSTLLKEALKRAYCLAACFESDDWQEEVLLNADGTITNRSYPVNSVTVEEITGDSIYIGTMKWFKYDPQGDAGEDKQLEAMADKWAKSQLNTLIQDLRSVAEFEEYGFMYV